MGGGEGWEAAGTNLSFGLTLRCKSSCLEDAAAVDQSGPTFNGFKKKASIVKIAGCETLALGPHPAASTKALEKNKNSTNNWNYVAAHRIESNSLGLGEKY